MNIIVQQNAGFCYGVKRAIEIIENDPSKLKYTLGQLIHNEQECKRLEALGIKQIDDYTQAEKGSTIFIRSHGATLKLKEEIKNNGYKLVDLTCPSLLKIYEKINKKHEEGYKIIIIGDPNHPEIIAMKGQVENNVEVVNSIDEAKKIKGEKLYVVSQTTNLKRKFLEISDIIVRGNTNVVIDNTICGATKSRQMACLELSKNVDCMIVIGGLNSSNTNKLYDIAKQNCKNVLRIETYKDICIDDSIIESKLLGITAGASTPAWIIEEVVNLMDNYSKDFMEQVEESMNKIYPKEIVKGEVIYVTDDEVMVNIGYKADGIIKLDELSTEEGKLPKDLYKQGDEIEVYVIKLDDGDGNVVLSTKRVEGIKNWKNLVSSFDNDSTVEAKVTQVVKGGLIATIDNVRAFIPGSQVTTHFVKDLSKYVGETLVCKVLNIDEKKRRLVLSHRAVVEEEQKEIEDKAWENITVGETITGKVQRLTDFGAFIDLGGVDGLLHISDISWNRIESPEDVLKVGDEIDTLVLKANREKNRISLGLKQLQQKPFDAFVENNHEADVIEGEVVNLVDFGAFVKLAEGIEGLVHVSEISNEHVDKPSDELNIGDTVKVKILEINPEKKRIALSMKALLPKPEKPERKPRPKKVKSKKVETKSESSEETLINSDLGALLDLKLKEIEEDN
ncbi:MAG: bifunctional 4-hydroxy-3-methylbut-2-enyl diphosphate reductase/30S ribosomal protein S1 [Finegoldia magna]|nr:bifunctional 4-hydroxy-3-methylbut-2-enyl diphosphate reductase/30S ribosomal protein S1 [Finegoldia magna]